MYYASQPLLPPVGLLVPAAEDPGPREAEHHNPRARPAASTVPGLLGHSKQTYFSKKKKKIHTRSIVSIFFLSTVIFLITFV